MPTEMTVHAVHQGEMRLIASAGEHTVNMDYPLRPGAEATGFRPLELLLARLAGCSGNALVALLRRSEQPVRGLEVTARGERRDEHPTIFTHIALEFVVHGAGVDPAAVAHALELAEDRLCPVWIMLQSGTNITSSFHVVGDMVEVADVARVPAVMAVA
jgi:putative redox protein